MALQTALTNDQLTDIRSGEYQTLQFVCLVPNTVVVRFQPSVAPTTAVYAEITVGSVGTGAMTNVKEGQTVIYSSTTDHQATEVFRGRVRKVSGTTILYVGECSQTLTTSMYVTVIDTYELHEKLRRSATQMDWEITFRKLLPIETALPSAVVLSNGTTSYAPTAVPKAMDKSATSSFTHLWTSSNGSDSISNATTASPTFTLQAAAFRWIRYTFTDSGGRVNYRVIPCWTVPKNYSSQVATGFIAENGDIATISHDTDLGWSATLPAFAGIENVLHKTLCVIASDEWIDDTRQAIRTNINLAGWLQNENTVTSGNADIGRATETTFTIEGIGHQLARLNVASATVIQVAATPTAFDQIQDPTPARMLTYHLTENTTLFNLCSMSVNADDTDFIGDDLTLSTGKALDDIRTCIETINAVLQYDVNGRLDLCRNLVYLNTTARDAAAVVVTFEQGDFSQHTIDFDYSKQTATLEMKGGVYNSSADKYVLYEAITPAVARLSEGDNQQINNQVLTTDATGAEAIIEISDRAANFFAAQNPTWTLRCTLNDEWHFLVPDVGAWFKFPLAETDTARGKVFSSSDRWQLVTISHTTNNITGRKQVEATFRLETQSTGAMVRANPIQNDAAADIIYYPAVTAPYLGANLDYTDGNWYDSQDPTPPSEPNPVPAECELGGLRIKSGDTYITRSWSSLYVSSMVRGSGLLNPASSGYGSEYDHSFSSGLGDWEIAMSGANAIGTLTGGRIKGRGDVFNPKIAQILLNFASPVTIDSVRILGERVLGISNGSHDTRAIEVRVTPNVSATNTPATGYRLIPAGHLPNGLFDNTGSIGTPIANISQVMVDVRVSESNPSSEIYLDRIVVAFVDGPAIVAAYGDAFYFSEDDGATWQAYDSGEGLLIEGSQPTGIPPYNPNHEYFLPQVLITGLATVSYEFNSPYSLADAENWSLQIITCEVPDPL